MSRYAVTEHPAVNDLLNIFDRHPEAFLHQHPLLPTARRRQAFMFCSSDGMPDSYALSEVRPFKALHVAFGPVGCTPENAAPILEALVCYLRQRTRIWRLSIQLPFAVEHATEDLVGEWQRRLAFRHSDRVLNWATLVLPVTDDAGAMMSGYSPHHRRNIRKAQRAGLVVRTLVHDAELEQLTALHLALYRHRRLRAQPELVGRQLTFFRDYFQQTGKGFLLGIFQSDRLLGGLAVAFRSRSAFYHFGVTDPSARHLPVAHLLFHEALLAAARAEMTEFDFGGYDPLAAPNSQTDHINRFKEGFGGRLVTHVPQLIFDLSPTGSRLTDLALLVRHRFRVLNR